MRVACVQMRSGISREENTANALALIAEAAGQGASFIATPEMTNAVDRDAKRLAGGLPDSGVLPEVTAFAAVAAKYGVTLLIGSVAEKREDGTIANRSYLLGPDGGTIATYDKVHMFDVALPNGETWRESSVYAPGDRAVIANLGAVKLGLTICYDLRFPTFFRNLAQAGANVFAVPAAFTRQTGKAHWETLLRARAIENGAFVIAPGQGGHHEDGRDTYGHSMIIGPWGEHIASMDHDAPGVLVADIDLAMAAAARARIPNLALERSVEIVKLPS